VLFLGRGVVGLVLQRFKAGKALTTSGARRARGKLTVADLDVLRRLLLVSDALFLDELQLGLFNATGKQVSLSCVVRGLAKLRITRKQVRRRERARSLLTQPPPQLHSIAAERSEEKRIKFTLRCYREFHWDQYLWIDESAQARRTPCACSSSL
jgi:hypothetical protein